MVCGAGGRRLGEAAVPSAAVSLLGPRAQPTEASRCSASGPWSPGPQHVPVLGLVRQVTARCVLSNNKLFSYRSGGHTSEVKGRTGLVPSRSSEGSLVLGSLPAAGRFQESVTFLGTWPLCLCRPVATVSVLVSLSFLFLLEGPRSLDEGPTLH